MLLCYCKGVRKVVKKNVEKLHRKANRVWFPMNTGERMMRSKKDYNRQKAKKEVRNYE
jgi:hypothetical protein